MKAILSLLAVAALLATPPLSAGDPAPKQIATEPSHHGGGWDAHRPDSHAPIGVMGDHVHEAGEIMLSYRYMFMDMRPNYVGDDEVTPRSQLSAPGAGPFQIMPTDMQTEMHMIGAMYAPTDDATLMLMLPVLEKTMDHLVVNGTRFNTRSNGAGDFKFGGLVRLFETENTTSHLNLMMSAPTGSITETGFVPPAGGVVRLPYPMQLGSGTWDLKPGVTWLGQAGDFSWGAQLLGALRLGENDENYSLGDEITGNVWGAWRLSDSLSASVRLSATRWGDIDGRDARIGGPVPTARPDLRGGERVDVFGGINYYIRGGALEGHRFAVEAGAPVHQDLDGPQLGMDWMITAGWQLAF